MRLERTDEVIAALEHRDLVPHPPHAATGGATMRLRAAMARFSGEPTHPARRAAVAAVVDALDLARLADAAEKATARRLTGDRIDATTIARTVPTEAMASALGLPVDERLIDDVHAVVAVIGRGGEPTATSDAAAERLLTRARSVGLDPVATASLLYQNTDATAAYLLARLDALASGLGPVAAVPRTRRVARVEVQLGAATIPAGTDVTLEIGAAGLPFGHGPHECPGRTAATILVDAALAAVVTDGYQPDASSVERDRDGRPVELSLVTRDETNSTSASR